MNRVNTAQHGPLVTVLISTYNRPRYLAEALASIVAQTWTNLDIILVRDGGLPVRDAIAEFLDDPRLTFIDRDQNRGLPYSFNEALSRARGEYVCYLGDDDKFYPFHVETLLHAMLGQDRCQVVYGDLYKAHCRVMPDGRRIVLAKNVEISRDFDRMLMLQFNHALHVSLLHRRDLLDKTGPYNENLNVMIDWDLTRRLCFFTDFLHVPIVTGEFYAPVGDCDRISIQRRKNAEEYLHNVLAIRSTRPKKPWPCMNDLSVIVLPGTESPAQMLRDLWSHCYYPNQFYVPLSPSEKTRFETHVPNVVPVAVAEGASPEARADAVLKVCQGNYIAIVPDRIQIPSAEVSFFERSLYPLMETSERQLGYELVEATPDNWGGVFRTTELAAARLKNPHLPLVESIRAADITIKRPTSKDFPFQFDNLINVAAQQGREGNWIQAAQLYDVAAERFDNNLWMQTLKANALYQHGRWELAATLAAQLNRTRPTVARLMIEGRARQKLGHFAAAAALFRRAEIILDGRRIEYPHDRPAAAAEDSQTTDPTPSRQQETLIWTS